MSSNINNRFVLFPIQHIEVWNMYKKAMSCFWTVEEIDLTKDKYNFSKLDKDIQYFIKNILAFFAASDGIVLENLAVNFLEKFQEPEIRCFYGFQIAMENIHSEMYSKLIDIFIDDEKEKDILFNSIQTIPTIKKKAEWALKWINISKSIEYIKKLLEDDDVNPDLKDHIKKYYYNNYNEEEILAKILLAFACVEGIFFSGSFCCIYWLRSRNDPLPGLSSSNDFIARDEGLHTDFACLLYKKFIKNKIKQDIVHEIVEEAVSIENDFIKSSLPDRLLGINSDMMQLYIKFIADRLLLELGYEKLFNIKEQPFAFMDRICLENKPNFFEHKPTEYSKFVDMIDEKKEDIYYLNGMELTDNF